MSALDPVATVPLGLVMLVVGVIVPVAIVRVVRARGRATRRASEMPNSHYASRLAREIETRHRWHGIALDRIHEINREEVVRLLAKLEAASLETLRANERAFLDRMAELAGMRSPVRSREKGGPVAPDSRQRPI